MVYEDDGTTCKHANVCVGSCRCGAKSEKDCECFEKDERSIWERGHDDGWIHTIYRIIKERRSLKDD